MAKTFVEFLGEIPSADEDRYTIRPLSGGRADLHLTLTPEEQRLFRKAAEKEGLPLRAWIRKTLIEDAEAKSSVRRDEGQ